MSTLNERIKEVRKDLGLSQKELAERIGISQRSVSWGEQPGNNVPDSTIKALCMAFRIRESWLRTGDGPMYAQPSTFSLDEYVHSHGATELELEILKVYFALDPEIRKTIFNHFKSNFFPAHIVASKEPPASPPNQNTETSFSVQAAEEDYIKKVLGSAPNTAYSALSSTSDTPSNKISNE